MWRASQAPPHGKATRNQPSNQGGPPSRKSASDPRRRPARRHRWPVITDSCGGTPATAPGSLSTWNHGHLTEAAHPPAPGSAPVTAGCAGPRRHPLDPHRPDRDPLPTAHDKPASPTGLAAACRHGADTPRRFPATLCRFRYIGPVEPPAQDLELTPKMARVIKAFLEEPQRPRYGFELMRLLGQPSGTLYPILAKFEQAGWIAGGKEDIDPRAEGRPARHNYSLTGLGARAARHQLAVLSESYRPPARTRPRLAPHGGTA